MLGQGQKKWQALGGRGRPCPVMWAGSKLGVASGWSYCPIATDSRKESDKGLHPGLLYQSTPLQGGLGHGLCVVSAWDCWETLGVVGRLVRAGSCLPVSVRFLCLSPSPVLIPDTQPSLPFSPPPPPSFLLSLPILPSLQPPLSLPCSLMLFPPGLPSVTSVLH